MHIVSSFLYAAGLQGDAKVRGRLHVKACEVQELVRQLGVVSVSFHTESPQIQWHDDAIYIIIGVRT